MRFRNTILLLLSNNSNKQRELLTSSKTRSRRWRESKMIKQSSCRCSRSKPIFRTKSKNSVLMSECSKREVKSLKSSSHLSERKRERLKRRLDYCWRKLTRSRRHTRRKGQWYQRSKSRRREKKSRNWTLMLLGWKTSEIKIRRCSVSRLQVWGNKLSSWRKRWAIKPLVIRKKINSYR